ADRGDPGSCRVLAGHGPEAGGVPMRATMTRRVTAWGAAAALLLGLAACSTGSGADDLGQAAPEESTSEPTDEPTGTPPAEPAECADPLASYDPLEALPAADALPSGSTMAEIRERGSLIVGVSADTLL